MNTQLDIKFREKDYNEPLIKIAKDISEVSDYAIKAVFYNGAGYFPCKNLFKYGKRTR